MEATNHLMLVNQYKLVPPNVQDMVTALHHSDNGQSHYFSGVARTGLASVCARVFA